MLCYYPNKEVPAVIVNYDVKLIYEPEPVTVMTPEERAYISPFEKMCAQVAREPPITFHPNSVLGKLGFTEHLEELHRRENYPILFERWVKEHPEDYKDKPY